MKNRQKRQAIDGGLNGSIGGAFTQADGTLISTRKVLMAISQTGKRIKQTAQGILIYFLPLFLLFTLSAGAQTPTIKKEVPTITKDARGNYVEVRAQDWKTNKTFTNFKGVVYPVYQSARGKEFIYVISQKTGNPYKVYLKVK